MHAPVLAGRLQDNEQGYKICLTIFTLNSNFIFIEIVLEQAKAKKVVSAKHTIFRSVFFSSVKVCHFEYINFDIKYWNKLSKDILLDECNESCRILVKQNFCFSPTIMNAWFDCDESCCGNCKDSPNIDCSKPKLIGRRCPSYECKATCNLCVNF